MISDELDKRVRDAQAKLIKKESRTISYSYVINETLRGKLKVWMKMNKDTLDSEIRETQKAIIKIESSNEPTTKGALKLAKNDLSYLLKQLSN